MKRKPLVSFVLVLVMLISLIPVASFATVTGPEAPKARVESNGDDYLTFTATGGAVTIKLQKNGNAPIINLEYQTKNDDGSWGGVGRRVPALMARMVKHPLLLHWHQARPFV